LTEDTSFQGGSLVKAIARINGEPVIPATSLKGALRSNYEAITYSCLGPIKTSAIEKFHPFDFKKSELPKWVVNKLPPDLRKRGGRVRMEVAFEDLKERLFCRLEKSNVESSKVCPACALFGTEGLQGRVWFEDASVTCFKRDDTPLQVNSMYQPRLHKVGSLRIVKSGRRPKVQAYQLKGRKAYYRVRWGAVKTNFRRSSPLDYLAVGTYLQTKLYFRNLIPAELGGTIVALGITPKSDFAFPFRTGGGKPLGLGVLGVHLEKVNLITDDVIWLDFDASPHEAAHAVTDPIIIDWILAFTKDAGLFYQDGLRQLHRVTSHPYVGG